MQFEVTSYLLNHTENVDPGHDQWRWCRKCYGLFFFFGFPPEAPAYSGWCPGEGGHDAAGSWYYSVPVAEPD